MQSGMDLFVWAVVSAMFAGSVIAAFYGAPKWLRAAIALSYGLAAGMLFAIGRAIVAIVSFLLRLLWSEE